MFWCSYIIPKANFRIGGLINAMVTHAAAFTPPESENKSTNNPNIKLIKMKRTRLLFTGNRRINRRYGNGFIKSIKLI